MDDIIANIGKLSCWNSRPGSLTGFLKQVMVVTITAGQCVLSSWHDTVIASFSIETSTQSNNWNWRTISGLESNDRKRYASFRYACHCARAWSAHSYTSHIGPPTAIRQPLRMPNCRLETKCSLYRDVIDGLMTSSNRTLPWLFIGRMQSRVVSTLAENRAAPDTLSFD